MAYQPKPGQFTLFKNQRKEAETHADYRGDGLLPDGTPVWVNAWIKEGAKGKFMSCTLKVKDGSKAKEHKAESPKGGGSTFDDMENDIPFLTSSVFADPIFKKLPR